MQAPTGFSLYLNSGIFHFPGDRPILLLFHQWYVLRDHGNSSTSVFPATDSRVPDSNEWADR